MTVPTHSERQNEGRESYRCTFVYDTKQNSLHSSLDKPQHRMLKYMMHVVVSYDISAIACFVGIRRSGDYLVWSTRTGQDALVRVGSLLLAEFQHRVLSWCEHDTGIRSCDVTV